MSRSVSPRAGGPEDQGVPRGADPRLMPPVRIGAAASEFGDVMPEVVAELYAAISDLVRCLRDAGEPPERVLIEVKHEVACVLGHGGAPFRRDSTTTRFIDQIISWTIETYYGPD